MSSGTTARLQTRSDSALYTWRSAAAAAPLGRSDFRRLSASAGALGARRRRQWLGALADGQDLAVLGHHRHSQPALERQSGRRADFPATDRDPSERPISASFGLREPGRLGPRSDARRRARARRPSRTRAPGRCTRPWRPPRRASPPSAGCSAGVRLAHHAWAWSGAAAPPRRAAASRGRAGPGATSIHTATRTRDDSASQMRRNRRLEGGLSLLGIRASRRVARPTPDGAQSAFPRRSTLTGGWALPVLRAAAARRRTSAAEALSQPGAARLPSSPPSVSTLDLVSRC